MRPLSAILARCKLDSDCLIWTGYSDRYGRIKIEGVVQVVHRVVWEIVNGCEVPNGYEVCHTCDRGICVWPEHLWIGTHAQNVLDCKLKGRAHSPRGEARHNARLTEAQVRAIRADTRLQREIGADYGMTQARISEIKLRKKWKHLV